MSFSLHYHSKVVSDDIPLLSRVAKVRVKKAIEEKLMVAPELFGKPLRQSLRGYRKLRVGDYRVIFRIEATKVMILAILHRSVVYRNAEQRASSE